MPKPVLITPELVGKQRIGQLSGCSLSLALAEYCEQTVGVKLLVAPDNLAATQLLAELSFFLSDEGKAQDLLFFLTGKRSPMINSHRIKISSPSACKR